MTQTSGRQGRCYKRPFGGPWRPSALPSLELDSHRTSTVQLTTLNPNMLFKSLLSFAVLLGAASAAAVPEADEGNLIPAEAVSIDNLPANFEKRQGGGYRCAPGKPCGQICIPRDRNCCGNEGHWCEFCGHRSEADSARVLLPGEQEVPKHEVVHLKLTNGAQAVVKALNSEMNARLLSGGETSIASGNTSGQQ